ncbi:thiamine phosphate synthase [Clostridium vitabionis]|uniref:thiamine phosphate synthase n=1 Tax=Clostridium vitabionis TaxID=2784388 RepID=UPI00188C552A|nr:thiamine phosphate synthase [Clostridium vitabionis]
MNCTKESLLLYLVTDRHWLAGRKLYDEVKKALDGGVTFVQVREKEDMSLSHEDYLREALALRELCAKYHVPFVVDDDVDLALECGCDGVHVGQTDMQAGRVREKIGSDKILGVSAQTVEEALLAERQGADYLGVGAVFPTGSKSDASEVSHETLRAICEAVSIPVIAIGGITGENVHELAGTGICGIAVISAIMAQKDVQAAARDLKTRTREALGL